MFNGLHRPQPGYLAIPILFAPRDAALPPESQELIDRANLMDEQLCKRREELEREESDGI